MEESFSSEHSSELFSNSLEHFLDSSGVTNESNRHFKTFWWDIADSGFNVIWNPFNKVWRVLVLDVEHLFINLFGWHSSSEHSGCGKISTVSWVRSTHHVFGIEHLLGKFWYSKGSVYLGSSWGKWSETNHEEMKSWERNKVNSEFSEIGVKLTWETDWAGNTRHGNRYKMVKITIGWSCKFKSSETDIIKSFIINNLDFISIFAELMNWKSSIIWFNNSIRYFWGWENGESFHNSVRIFFSDFGDKECTHTRSSTTTKRVSNLETLKAIATFSFFSYNIENGIDQFSSFSIMSFGPIVSCSSLSENEVVWSEKLSKWSSSIN